MAIGAQGGERGGTAGVGDAYILHVADTGRPAALSALRANSHVMVAEPIDGDARP